MENRSQKFSAADVMAEDDIDELFLQLEQFEPPTDFVARVMNAVSGLPLPQIVTEKQLYDGEVGLIVHREHLQPS